LSQPLASATTSLFRTAPRAPRCTLFPYTTLFRSFRAAMTNAGFTLAGAGHAIVPVMIGDAALAVRMADELLKRGIYVIAFSFPVVPRGQARIRTQMSAAHTRAQLEQAVAAFTEVGKELGVIA